MSVLEKLDTIAASQIDIALLGDVEIALEARLGEATLTISDLTALKSGSVVILDRSLADHADIYLNGKMIARGEIVAVDKSFGIRITEIAKQ